VVVWLQLPWVSTNRAFWKLGGEIESLQTDDRSATVAQETRTELLFLLRVADPMTLAIADFMHTCEPRRELHEELKILGSTIRFTYQLGCSSGATDSGADPLPWRCPVSTEKGGQILDLTNIILLSLLDELARRHVFDRAAV
jgi:hypothetical protein